MTLQRESSPLSTESESFLRWLAGERGRSANTVAAYRRDLTAYERWLGEAGSSVGEAEGAAVARYLAELTAAGRRAASVTRALVAIRALHRYAGSDAAVAIDGPTVAPVPPAALSRTSVDRLLSSVLLDGPIERRDRAILELLYRTGLRTSELVGLDLADVDAEAGVAHVVAVNGRPRTVPVPPPAVVKVDEWLAPPGRPSLVGRGRETALFVNARGGRLSRQAAWALVRQRGKNAGLGETVGPQLLRHTCAAHLLDDGVAPPEVRRILGQVGR